LLQCQEKVEDTKRGSQKP